MVFERPLSMARMATPYLSAMRTNAFIENVPDLPNLQSARSKIDDFTRNGVRHLQADVTAHQAFLRQARARLAELKAERRDLQARARAVREEAAREKEAADGVKAEIAGLQEQSNGLPARLREIREREDEIRTQVQQLEAEVEKHVDENDRTTNDLTQGVIAFKTRLGLDFERIGEDQLKLNMTSIDPRDPDRTFAFAVHIDQQDQYHMILCEPPVARTDRLLEELNTSNNFSRFVRKMRKAFCDHAALEANAQ